MIDGAHMVLYSQDAEADRAFLRDVIGLPHVDVGHGWLIFKAPPAELAVHPGETNDVHELFLMCDDLDVEIARLEAAGAPCDAPTTQGWGRSTRITLPGGGKLGLYQPRHARP
jgi:predicted enzyme related to lactoylglutathione lyase